MTFYTRSITVSDGLNIVKAMSAFIIGGIVVHLIVMSLDYFPIIKPLLFDLRGNFTRSIFSAPMFPTMIICGLFSLTICFLWEKKKYTILLARESKIKNEKVDAVLKSMQRMTGLLAEHIAVQNSEILNWIENKKRKGQQVSEKVENPNKKIAQALQSLSEMSFVIPYTENRPGSIGEFENMLKSKLNEITKLQSEKKYSSNLKNMGCKR
jgi:hypothetical protein